MMQISFQVWMYKSGMVFINICMLYVHISLVH